MAMLSIAAMLALVALSASGAVWITSRQRARRRRVARRSEYHEALLAAVAEWLCEPEIVEILRDRHVMTAGGIRVALETAGQYNEAWVRALGAKITSDRIVRRKLAAYVARKHGVTKHSAMTMLTQIVGDVRPEISTNH